jgi:hypothetical protein
MNHHWSDITSYQRGEPHVPRVWELRAAGIRIRVHRLHGIHDQWFLSSDFHNDSPIDARDEFGAKLEAVTRIRDIAEEIALQMNKVVFATPEVPR